MRGIAYPAPGFDSRRRGLKHAVPPSAAAATLLLVFVLATGGPASPLLVALTAVLIVVAAEATLPLLFGAPIVVAATLLMHASVSGDVDAGDIVVAITLIASVVPGLMWRRERKRGGLQLVDADATSRDEHSTGGSVEPTAAEEMADLERALGAVTARVEAQDMVLWHVDGYRGVARARAAALKRPARPVTLAGDALGWVWEQGMRLRLDPAPSWAAPGVVVVAERLRRHEESGVLVTYAFDPAHVPEDDLMFEESAVYLRGMIALQEARADAAASRRRVNSLVSGLGRIPDELDLDTFAHGLCETAMAVTDATGAAVGMWSSAGEVGELLAVAGEDGGPAAGDIFEPPASELALAIRANAPLVRDADDWRLGRTHIARPDERWTARPRSLAVLPLRGANSTIGALAVWSSSDARMDPEAVELLHLLTPYAAQHIEHASAFGRMRESAERDPLTKLRNRRSFDEIFAAETTRFERYGRPLSMLMLDLDHFKAVNDDFGHEAGDEVLRLAAQSVADCVREIDIAARLGGEEFVVLLPETGTGAALEVAERIRRSIDEREFRWRGSTIPVTVSIGVACSPDHVAHPRQLMGASDAALYRAKSAGRNRVEQGASGR